MDAVPVDPQPWIWTRGKFGVVMPFVHERCSTIFKTITIRRIRADRHQNYRVISAQPKVHPLLKAGTFSLAHINVGNDVVAHRVYRRLRKKLAGAEWTADKRGWLSSRVPVRVNDHHGLVELSKWRR
jgi:hypothetical protein